jgi:hypothetical protein
MAIVFTLTESQRKLQTTVRAFAQESLEPAVREAGIISRKNVAVLSSGVESFADYFLAGKIWTYCSALIARSQTIFGRRTLGYPGL